MAVTVSISCWTTILGPACILTSLATKKYYAITSIILSKYKIAISLTSHISRHNFNVKFDSVGVFKPVNISEIRR